MDDDCQEDLDGKYITYMYLSRVYFEVTSHYRNESKVTFVLSSLIRLWWLVLHVIL